MSKWLKLAGLAVLGIVVLVAALIAVPAVMAQEPDPTPIPYGPRSGYGMRSGMMGGYADAGAYHDEMHTAVAGVLSLTVDELDAALAEGKTMWQIAEEQGVEPEAVWEAMAEVRAEVLAQLVDDNVITQEQADWMLERMQLRSTYQGSYGPGMMGGGFRGGGHMGGGLGSFGSGNPGCPYYPGGQN